eukprot:5786263-Prymnesium_polylepis.1
MWPLAAATQLLRLLVLRHTSGEADFHVQTGARADAARAGPARRAPRARAAFVAVAQPQDPRALQADRSAHDGLLARHLAHSDRALHDALRPARGRRDRPPLRAPHHAPLLAQPLRGQRAEECAAAPAAALGRRLGRGPVARGDGVRLPEPAQRREPRAADVRRLRQLVPAARGRPLERRRRLLDERLAGP